MKLDFDNLSKENENLKTKFDCLEKEKNDFIDKNTKLEADLIVKEDKYRNCRDEVIYFYNSKVIANNTDPFVSTYLDF
jgi:predicted nuclease with TOPRIM domain